MSNSSSKLTIKLHDITAIKYTKNCTRLLKLHDTTATKYTKKLAFPYLLKSNNLSWQSFFTFRELHFRDKTFIAVAILKPITVPKILPLRIRSRTRKNASSSIIMLPLLPTTTSTTPSSRVVRIVADGRQYCQRKSHLAIKKRIKKTKSIIKFSLTN